MWSLYHAARYDVVGQCRQSIEALLPLFYEKAANSDMIRLGLELVRTTTECLHLQKSQILVVYQILWQGHVCVLYWEAFTSRWPSLWTTLGDLLLEDIANQE